VSRLHTSAEFRTAMGAAREEIESARGKSLVPARDCAAEAEAMAVGG
jgi:hypothetical protein